MTSGAGRFAPSPTGRLHLGNLRTALLAWLFARSRGERFLLRFEDLDTSSVRDEHYVTQADDLAALGLDWDGAPVRQSERMGLYRSAIADLVAADRVYECFCSRKDIREASQAPNGPAVPSGHYPGTCRSLSASERRRRAASGRPPALRFRSDGGERSLHDIIRGPFASAFDDFVVRRGDGTPAYNLAAPVDDAEQGVTLVVRADDLLDSTPRQLALLEALGLGHPEYAHVPLVLNGVGDRLAKRDGSVTLADRGSMGQDPVSVRSALAASLGLCEPFDRPTLSELVDRFDASTLPRHPWTLSAETLAETDLGLT